MFIKQENQDNYRARFPNNTVNRHDCSITISLSLGSTQYTSDRDNDQQIPD